MRTRTETGVRSQQDGRGQRGAHAHKTTLPFVGRVVGHVRLYGERGREGGAERDGHQEKFDEGPRVSATAAGLKDQGQEPRV